VFLRLALPEDSYGRRNREVIAARETRIAARLRATERIPCRRRPRPHPGTPTHQLTILDGRTPDHELELE
jgi:hypothetical protein